ncbi:Piso0_003727 [Millerozyma farinosa CBS 7064]|uniref:Oxidation resistance protein 1 n=1 Tax=Pichia sorbitophila (strain ATCC MYA-4447 / BCRC 22081 / CBS 7064 / NBRC 10061 / NRRL Y-12695) TaxID=559304 RepID=G8Y6F6_PICSO|nr:Piso0_003727 [Millerozyma farinosa CBS 7064]CCE84186.1 Piso0_003727 [Millerozyma farinosa CBS 7064]
MGFVRKKQEENSEADDGSGIDESSELSNAKKQNPSVTGRRSTFLGRLLRVSSRTDDDNAGENDEKPTSDDMQSNSEKLSIGGANQVAGASAEAGSGATPGNLRDIQPTDHGQTLAPVTLTGYKDTTKHRLLDGELAEDIRKLVPARLQLFDTWELVYSLEQHGISLKTLYQRCKQASNASHGAGARRSRSSYEEGYAASVVGTFMSDPWGQNGTLRRPQGYVMVIKDSTQAKFGCFLNEAPRPMDQKRYYGNGECFLWKCDSYTHNSPQGLPHMRFKAYVYTGINDNIIYSNHDSLSVGSSRGHNGLWIDRSLDNGVSCPCDTFGNEVLCGPQSQAPRAMGKFKVVGLEVWRIGPVP